LKTILLIDDDAAIRETFGLALRQQGYQVLVADSGGSGLKLALLHPPDLILSDINMPGGDGKKLLEQIRETPALSTTQVVLMTGRPDLVTPRSGMEAGADDFLVKPVKHEALLRCVHARLVRAEVHWRVEDRILENLRSSVPTQLPHEFFTPLAGIIGLSEILCSTFAPAFTKEVQGFHQDIHASALRLHRTLRNYLMILELQGETPDAGKKASRLPIEEWEKSVQAGVKEAARRNGRLKDVTVRLDGTPEAIRGSDLILLMEELVDNACKFSPAETPIEVHHDGQRAITVTDRGRGMTAEDIRRVGAFQQFDQKKYGQQGLGLGLILVQKIAAKYGAKLSVESEPGQGARVQVRFSPASPPPAASAPG
jgi:signal transduction histidine kinase